MSLDEPRKGEAVDRLCFVCRREPRPGETYGPHAEGWDFTGFCPECWDQTTKDPDEEDPLADEEALRCEEERALSRDDEMETFERDAVVETFGEDGALYEDMTGKTLGDK